MNTTIPIAMFGWPLVAVVLFAVLPPRRALLAGLLLSWLLLPMYTYIIPALHYDKFNAPAIGVLLGVCIFDTARLKLFRPKWFDVPIFILCAMPVVSTLGNEQDYAYAGVSLTNHVFGYGIPYVLGRIYFRSMADIRDLVWAVFIGGLICVPLCLYEIRMSPQLHSLVYGFHQHQFLQSRRYGGWRPTLFMQHGLAVGMWMCAASVAGIGVYLAHRRPRPAWLGWGLLLLLGTTILCKSVGALVLLGLGSLVLVLRGIISTRWYLLALVATIPLYMGARASGLLSCQTACTAVQTVIRDPERVDSMRFRLTQEDAMCMRAASKPLVGWGPWGDFRNAGVAGDDLTGVTDAMWIILFGKYGLLGLISYNLVLLIPASFVVLRAPGHIWRSPALPGVAGLAVILVLYAIDGLSNAMPNPIFILIAGALATLASQRDFALKAASEAAKSHAFQHTYSLSTARPGKHWTSPAEER